MLIVTIVKILVIAIIIVVMRKCEFYMTRAAAVLEPRRCQYPGSGLRRKHLFCCRDLQKILVLFWKCFKSCAKVTTRRVLSQVQEFNWVEEKHSKFHQNMRCQVQAGKWSKFNQNQLVRYIECKWNQNEVVKYEKLSQVAAPSSWDRIKMSEQSKSSKVREIKCLELKQIQLTTYTQGWNRKTN